MTKGAFYKHENFDDMVVLCLKSFRVPRGYKVKVHYHFRSAVDGAPIPHGELETILITNSQLPKWKRYTWGKK